MHTVVPAVKTRFSMNPYHNELERGKPITSPVASLPSPSHDVELEMDAAARILFQISADHSAQREATRTASQSSQVETLTASDLAEEDWLDLQELLPRSRGQKKAGKLIIHGPDYTIIVCPKIYLPYCLECGNYIRVTNVKNRNHPLVLHVSKVHKAGPVIRAKARVVSRILLKLREGLSEEYHDMAKINWADLDDRLPTQEGYACQIPGCGWVGGIGGVWDHVHTTHGLDHGTGVCSRVKVKRPFRGSRPVVVGLLEEEQ